MEMESPQEDKVSHINKFGGREGTLKEKLKIHFCRIWQDLCFLSSTLGIELTDTYIGQKSET